MKIRFIIIAILLGLRLYGGDSELIKATTVIGMTVTAFTIIFRLIRGREKRPMGGNFAFYGVLTSICAVMAWAYYTMKINGAINFFMLPIVFGALAVFALALMLMKKRKRPVLYIGGLLAGGAVSLVVLCFVVYLVLGATNGFTPVHQVYAYSW